MSRVAAPPPSAPHDAVTIDRGSVDRFARDLSAVVDLSDGTVVAVAVSGGPDSMALLALALAARPGRVVAATVDHRLRDANAQEAAMVAGWCRAAAIPHAMLTIAAPPPPTGNRHAWARGERYRLLGDWAAATGAHALLTAHHADDQAETFLMRALRATGPAGLSGIRASRPLGPIRLARPLLAWRRAELRMIAGDARLPFVDDPSNADDRYERTRIRAVLAQAAIDPLPLARSAALVAEAEADLAAMTDWLWHTRSADAATGGGAITLDIAGLPRELRRRLARRAIAAVLARSRHSVAAWHDAANIEPLLDAAGAGRAATHADILLTPRGTLWHFALAPPRRSP